MYNKLFTKILDSSIWLESTATRIVWMTFIAVMDETGFVQFASVANVAHRARVTVDEAIAAVDCLEAPDPNSSDPEHDGRRVERVPGGWLVLNAEKHRQVVTKAIQQEQNRDRVRRFRARAALDRNGSVTVGNGNEKDVTTSEAVSEAGSGSEAGGGTASAARILSSRGKRPVFTGRKLTVFEWQLDDCMQALGTHTDAFELDLWFQALDDRAVARNVVLPRRDGGAWLREQLLDEIARRKLPITIAAAKPAAAKTGNEARQQTREANAGHVADGRLAGILARDNPEQFP